MRITNAIGILESAINRTMRNNRFDLKSGVVIQNLEMAKGICEKLAKEKHIDVQDENGEWHRVFFQVRMDETPIL